MTICFTYAVYTHIHVYSTYTVYIYIHTHIYIYIYIYTCVWVGGWVGVCVCVDGCVCVCNIWTDVKLPLSAFHWDCVQRSYQWNGISSLASWTYLHHTFEEIYLISLILFNCTFWDSVPDGSLQWCSSCLVRVCVCVCVCVRACVCVCVCTFRICLHNVVPPSCKFDTPPVTTRLVAPSYSLGVWSHLTIV